MTNTWVYDFGNFKMALRSKSDADILPRVQKFGWHEDEKFETKVFAKNLKKGLIFLLSFAFLAILFSILSAVLYVRAFSSRFCLN